MDIVRDGVQRIQDIEDCRTKLLKNPSAVWKNWTPSEDEKEAQAQIKILVNSHYKKSQVNASNKKIKISYKNKNLLPVQRHKDECRKVANQLWAKNPDRTIADIIVSDEINKVTAPKVYNEKTIRNDRSRDQTFYVLRF
jgi:hypothetical protein